MLHSLSIMGGLGDKDHADSMTEIPFSHKAARAELRRRRYGRFLLTTTHETLLLTVAADLTWL